MRKYRAAARHATWYDEEGDPPLYKSLHKVRSRRSPGVDDEENAAHVPTSVLENQTTNSVVLNRRSRLLSDYNVPLVGFASRGVSL